MSHPQPPSAPASIPDAETRPADDRAQSLSAQLRAARAERAQLSERRRLERTHVDGSGISASFPRNQTRTSADSVIASTDIDAASSRLSAVNAGWLQDPYADIFCPDSDVPPRRMPIINRGTFVRTKAVDERVTSFLSTIKPSSEKAGSRDVATNHPFKRQVLSLGAGTDTRFPRFLREGRMHSTNIRWVEVDFPETMERKRKVMRTVGVGEDDGWRGIGMDLRELCDGTDGIERLRAQLWRETPTLVLSEMCLTYLMPVDSTRILHRIVADVLEPLLSLQMVFYEPVEPGDAFGKTMVQNLAMRGIRLPGMLGFPTLDSHKQRLLSTSLGLDSSEYTTVGQWWKDRVSSEEKEQLRAVEMVDEEEEWVLLAAHYGLVWGWRDSVRP